MPETSEISNPVEPKTIARARAAARKRFERFRDDGNEPTGVRDPENPPMTDEQLGRLRPAHDVHPKLVAASLHRKAGRPRSEAPKRAVSIRLDPDLVDALKASGTGWQTRVNELLRKAFGLTA